MIEVNSLTLNNGLRLLHHFDATTQMVALNLLYDVGAKDEKPGMTGFAHLFEHLMFSGSENIPNFDLPLQEAGGDSNAWTSNDTTNYFDIIPAQNIETAFWLESDRLNRLMLSQHALDVQKGVVIEEFKQRVSNVPYGDIDHILRDTAFKVHPYRWPVIGRNYAEIESASLDSVSDFFYSHYSPRNLIMCVAGNISFDKAALLAQKWMEPIHPRNIATRDLPPEPPQSSPRRVEASRNVPQTMIVKAYHMCGRKHPDFKACDILSDILANGNSSRFFQNIILKSNLFSDIDASVWGSIDPGLFVIKGKLNPGAPIDKAEKLIEAEIKKITDGSVSQYEVEKYVNKLESKESFENINYSEKAPKLCFYQLLGDASYINHEIDDYRTLSPNDITLMANCLFNKDNETTVLYGPDL